MKLKLLLEKIFNHPSLLNNPPVLLDIGASGKIHQKWKKIAKHSICVAFDADEREFNFIINEDSGFKKLYTYNCIVTDEEGDEKIFYLTKSPYCSSLLEPDRESLRDLILADKFEVEKREKLKTKKLIDVLSELNISQIDWFKTDSQGIDLRLFKSLGVSLYNDVLVAEFEPGIIDAYKGEDKLYQLLDFMNNKNFWMADLNVQGSVRITKHALDEVSNNKFLRKLTEFSLKKSPGWAEVTYINNFNEGLSIRDYLLGWTFSTILNQHGFAYELAKNGIELFKDSIFESLKFYSLRKIKKHVLKFKFLQIIPRLFH